jgi:hypothetical protein
MAVKIMLSRHGAASTIEISSRASPSLAKRVMRLGSE